MSKRLPSGAFSRQGDVCPRRAPHAAFASPSRVASRIVERPDGKRFVTFARAVQWLTLPFGEPQASVVVALGCKDRFAARPCHGRELKGCVSVAIGVNCRLCERPACPSRAAPLLLGPLEVAKAARGLSPFGW